MISDNHGDVAMHYEELAKAVFDCDRFEDPWGYADAGMYDAHFAPEPDAEAKIILNTIVDVAIWDNKEEEALVASLKEIKDRIGHMNNQDEALSIIHDVIDLLNENGY